MPPIDESASFEPKPSAAEGRRSKTAPVRDEQPTSGDLVSLTVDPATGRIVKIEGVNSAGERRELSEEERGRLAGTGAKATLERVFEQAFEAGIDAVLGDATEEAKQAESQEDAELSRMLLRSLIERSVAKRLMHSDVLGPAIIGTLIEQAAGARGGTSESAAPH